MSAPRDQTRTSGSGLTRSWPPSVERVTAARDGDRIELGRILAEGFPKLVAFYRGAGLRHADADELASEALEGMVKNLPSLREPVAFEAWFWSVARNRFRSKLRTKGRDERELEYPPVDDPEDLAIAGEEYTLIRQAMAQLSIRDRQVLWLREVEGLSHAEIAGRMKLATGAVRVAALRARRRLAEIYEDLHPESS